MKDFCRVAGGAAREVGRLQLRLPPPRLSEAYAPGAQVLTDRATPSMAAS